MHDEKKYLNSMRWPEGQTGSAQLFCVHRDLNSSLSSLSILQLALCIEQYEKSVNHHFIFFIYCIWFANWLMGWIAETKGNIGSTLRQPTCSILHTLMTSWSNTWPQSKYSHEVIQKLFISVKRRLLSMTPKMCVHLKNWLQQTLGTKAWFMKDKLIKFK